MTIETLSKNNVPMWAANIILVFGFLAYMEMDARRGDLVAEQRIKQCHAVQEDGIDGHAIAARQYGLIFRAMCLV